MISFIRVAYLRDILGKFNGDQRVIITKGDPILNQILHTNDISEDLIRAGLMLILEAGRSSAPARFLKTFGQDAERRMSILGEGVAVREPALFP